MLFEIDIIMSGLLEFQENHFRPVKSEFQDSWTRRLNGPPSEALQDQPLII